MDFICPCGKAFTATAKSRRWCSPVCRETSRTATRNHLRRVGTTRHAPELITVATLGERDDWTCHLCRADVRQDAAYPDPESGSIDHLIPVSDGGPHTLANTALAHLRCNVRRGRRAIAA
jgi:hypothetical protein